MLEDMEQKDDFGTPQERQRILSILKEWVDSQPDRNMPIYITAIDIKLTLGDIVEHIEEETAIGVLILDTLFLKVQESQETAEFEIKKFFGGQLPPLNLEESKKDEE